MTTPTQSIIRTIVIAGIFAIPFIPFIVANEMFFPFITGKAFTFRILVEVLFALWLLLAYWNPAYRPKLGIAIYSVIAFIGIIAIADFFGENPYKSIWSNYERMEGLVTLIHLGAYFLITTTILNTKELWEKWFKVSLIASALLAIYALFQLWGIFEIHQSDTRLDATFGNSAYFAVYLLIHIFLAGFLLLKEKALNMKYAYGALILLNTFILYYTGTRGALLGLIGGSILSALLITFIPHDEKKYKKIATGFLIGITILIAGFFALKNTSVVQNNETLSRVASISLEEGGSRFMIWGMALEGFKERPLLGWGQENFNFVFNKYYDPGMYNQEQWFDRAHNVFLDWLIAGGILGLLGYLSLFGAALYLLWRKTNFSIPERSILTGLFAAYFIHNLFVFDNLMSYILFFSLLGYLHTITRTPKDELPVFKTNKSMNALIAPLVIVIMVVSVYGFNYKAVAANYALIEGLRSAGGGQYDMALANFDRTFGYESFGTSEAREQMSRMMGALLSGQVNVDSETLQLFANRTAQELQLQAERLPGDARYQYFYGVFLNTISRNEESIVYLKKALELSPTKQTMMFPLAQSYAQAGNTEQALSLARQAYELDISFTGTRNLYAIFAIYANELELADELLASAEGFSASDDQRFIQAYVAIERYDKIIEIWKRRIENTPDNAMYYLSIGAAYLADGQRTNAIEAIRSAIEVDPQFKEQGEFFISEIRAGRNP